MAIPGFEQAPTNEQVEAYASRVIGAKITGMHQDGNRFIITLDAGLDLIVDWEEEAIAVGVYRPN